MRWILLTNDECEPGEKVLVNLDLVRAFTCNGKDGSLVYFSEDDDGDSFLTVRESPAHIAGLIGAISTP